MMNDNTEILGVRIIGEKESGEFDTFKVGDICFIDVWSPKKNYLVPRFHTKQGVFSALLTLEACAKAMDGLVRLDNGILANLKHIQLVTETPFAITAHFGEGIASANVAKNKKRLVEAFIRK
jgi:hypothetical protein